MSTPRAHLSIEQRATGKTTRRTACRALTDTGLAAPGSPRADSSMYGHARCELPTLAPSGRSGTTVANVRGRVRPTRHRRAGRPSFAADHLRPTSRCGALTGKRSPRRLVRCLAPRSTGAPASPNPARVAGGADPRRARVPWQSRNSRSRRCVQNRETSEKRAVRHCKEANPR